MVRCLLSVLLLLGFANTLCAQAAYNPYAPQMEDPSPINADGKPNWPSFYRSTATAAKFQGYFEMGSCVGTKKSVNDLLKNNKVDVNKLPEATVAGRVISIEKGLVTLADKENHKIGIVAHPAGVSKIAVSGRMPLSDLRKGMIVRMLSSVDAHGQRTEPVTSFEIISPAGVNKVPEITPGKLQTIVGTISKLHGDHMQMKVTTGPVRNLTFVVSPQAEVTVDGSQLDLVALGDTVNAVGHQYQGQGIATEQQIFANEITVTKPEAGETRQAALVNRLEK